MPEHCWQSGAHDRDRTGDLVLTKDVLYRLSYVGPMPRRSRCVRAPGSGAPKVERETGLEPATLSLEG